MGQKPQGRIRCSCRWASLPVRAHHCRWRLSLGPCRAAAVLCCPNAVSCVPTRLKRPLPNPLAAWHALAGRQRASRKNRTLTLAGVRASGSGRLARRGPSSGSKSTAAACHSRCVVRRVGVAGAGGGRFVVGLSPATATSRRLSQSRLPPSRPGPLPGSSERDGLLTPEGQNGRPAETGLHSCQENCLRSAAGCDNLNGSPSDLPRTPTSRRPCPQREAGRDS